MASGSNWRLAEAEKMVGQTIGRYELREVLGYGGMGVVYRAADPTLERDVALKVLFDIGGETSKQRFLNEARAAAKLESTRTVVVHEVGEYEGKPFIVMEMVPGGSLADRIGGHAIDYREATRMIMQACEGMAVAHDEGILHRDLKPANLLLTKRDEVKIADFGLVKRLDSDSQAITQHGDVLGSPQFMSPEQFTGEQVDHRSDIYSLGATYFALLTGNVPYSDSETMAQMIYAHTQKGPPNPRALNEALPEGCTKIIARAMATSPDDRYETMREMLADLQGLLGGSLVVESGVKKKSAWPVIAALSCIAVGVALGVWALDGPKSNVVTDGNLATEEAPVESEPMADQGGNPQEDSLRPPESIGEAAAAVDPEASGGGSETSEGDLGGTNDDALASQPENGAPIPAPVPPPPPIKIGVFPPSTSPSQKHEADVLTGVRAAVEEINAGEKVLGRSIELILAEEATTWQEYQQQASRLIDDEEVDVLIGTWTAVGRKAVAEVVKQKDRLLIYPAHYGGLEQLDNVIYLGALPNQLAIPAAKWAKESLNRRRAYLVGVEGQEFPHITNLILRDEIQKFGMTVVGETYLPPENIGSDFMIQTILQSGADIVLSTIEGDANIGFYRALRGGKFRTENLATLAFCFDQHDLPEFDTSKFRNDFVVSGFLAAEESADQAAQESMGARFLTDAMVTSYASVLLWADAVASTGTTEKDATLAAMPGRSIGVLGETFGIGPSRHAERRPFVGELKADGSIVRKWEGPAMIAPDLFPGKTAAEWAAILNGFGDVSWRAEAE